MNQLSISILLTALSFLLLCSAFFSSAETSMMAINRYKLRHMAKKGHRAACRTYKLLARPDRLLSVILIGNNFVNILASAIATILAVRLIGEHAIVATTLAMTLLVLIFGEVTPKTIATIYPERIAFVASFVLSPLLKIMYPIVWTVNIICSCLMTPFGIRLGDGSPDQLSAEELRTLVNESGRRLPQKRKNMLLGILDLEKVTVEDIIIPRNKIIGINIEHDIKTIIEQLKHCQHTRIPVYRSEIDTIIGMLHMRKIARLLSLTEVTKPMLLRETIDPYYIPEGTSLYVQMINFQKEKERTALVVDEYGDITGLITLEDILEEIVGDFTSEVSNTSQQIVAQKDGSYIVDGATAIRDINRLLNWHLPIDEARTLSGLITEEMELIPESAVCFRLEDYCFEILQVRNHRVHQVKVFTLKGN